MKPTAISFLAGVVFALGLGIAGMTQPAKVVGFLDFFGHWDPSLVFVMGGAIVAHFAFARRAMKGGAPRFAPKFELPTRRDLDARLIAGAAIFGVGWGLGGLCPGPAIVSITSRTPTTLAFVASMLASIAVYRRVVRPAPTPELVERVA